MIDPHSNFMAFAGQDPGVGPRFPRGRPVRSPGSIVNSGNRVGRQPFSLLLLCLFVCLLAACEEAPTLPPLAPGTVVLAFGDSLTYGTGVDPASSYPAVLSELIDLQVINSGVPGELSAAGLARLPGVLADTRPALVILCHGGNDLLRRRSATELQDNLRQMIELVRTNGAQVVLLGVPAPGIFLRAAELYDVLAEELQVPLDADTLADIEADAKLKSDGVHPNAAGYRQLALAVQTLLIERGALPPP